MAENDFTLRIRRKCEADRAWVEALLRERWGAEVVVVHGHTYHPAQPDSHPAEPDGDPACPNRDAHNHCHRACHRRGCPVRLQHIFIYTHP